MSQKVEDNSSSSSFNGHGTNALLSGKKCNNTSLIKFTFNLIILKLLICLFTIFRTLPKFSLTHCQNVLNVTVKNIAWMFINTLLTILCEVSLRASTLLKKIATFSPIHWKEICLNFHLYKGKKFAFENTVKIAYNILKTL